MFLTGYAPFDWDMAAPDLTNYSRLLLDRLIPADPYTPNVIRNLKDKEQPKRDDRHYAPGTLATGGVLKQCAAHNCHNVVETEALCKLHRGGLRAGYPIAILSSR